MRRDVNSRNKLLFQRFGSEREKEKEESLCQGPSGYWSSLSTFPGRKGRGRKRGMTEGIRNRDTWPLFPEDPDNEFKGRATLQHLK